MRLKCTVKTASDRMDLIRMTANYCKPDSSIRE